MTIKENDFVEIEYTGKITDGNIVFDTTSESEAKAAGIYNPQSQYKPMIICVGHQHIIKGIDKFIVGKELNKEYTVDIKPEDGFGKKKGDLLQLIATPKFKKHGINPVPGLQVNIDNTIGIIKTVTGGRTLVDFNHPCAGKDLTYKVKVTKFVTDAKEKVKAVATMLLGPQLIQNVEVKDAKAELTIPMKFPQEIEEKITESIKKTVPEITEIVYHEKTEKKQEKIENI
ncbi:MAG: peptidylprolyl isomerase [Nanoarchaeota archaeon]